MIVVIDYNVGNVKSVCNALHYIGSQAKLSSEPADIKQAAGLVLPGVAAFGYATKALGGTAEVIKENVTSGKPLLGICVGYQLLFDESCEHGRHKGLGLICGDVVSLPEKVTIPHMGWNRVKYPSEFPLFAGLAPEKHFYFAHSYYPRVTDSKTRLATTDYGFSFVSAVRKGNIYGTQFHPEKSGPQGLQLLENFVRIAEGGIDNAD